MKYLSELFFKIHSVYYFSSFLGGLAFLGRINTRVYTKLLPQYQTVQKCSWITKPIFNHLEQVKVKFFWGGGGSTSILEGVYHCKTIAYRTARLRTNLDPLYRSHFYALCSCIFDVKYRTSSDVSAGRNLSAIFGINSPF